MKGLKKSSFKKIQTTILKKLKEVQTIFVWIGNVQESRHKHSLNSMFRVVA